MNMRGLCSSKRNNTKWVVFYHSITQSKSAMLYTIKLSRGLPRLLHHKPVEETMCFSSYTIKYLPLHVKTHPPVVAVLYCTGDENPSGMVVWWYDFLF